VNILEEAGKLTTVDRNKAYGHPVDDFSKQIGMLKILFSGKSFDDLVAEDMAIIQIVVKLSRWSNAYKRDHIVDIAGYARTVEMIHERQSEVSAPPPFVSYTSTTMTAADALPFPTPAER